MARAMGTGRRTSMDKENKMKHGEILTLIDWFLDNRLKQNEDTIRFDSGCREGLTVEISYVQK